jgi:multimeric flavodoxin WrbA
MKKTIIINGSPRVNGNTAYLIAELKKHLEGEVIEISAFRSGIAPCVDCRACWTTAKCVVEDDMQIIYDDDFDNIVIASPVYYSTLPGSVLSLMSRLQPWHAATFFIKEPLKQRPKKSAAILTAGGKGNEANAQHHLSAFFKQVNATGLETILCVPERPIRFLHGKTKRLSPRLPSLPSGLMRIEWRRNFRFWMITST